MYLLCKYKKLRHAYKYSYIRLVQKGAFLENDTVWSGLLATEQNMKILFNLQWALLTQSFIAIAFDRIEL